MNFSDNYSDYHSSDTGCNYEIHSRSDLPANLDFSLDEIRDQLKKLGYSQIPDEKLLDIKKDLDEIISRDDSLQEFVHLPQTGDSSDWFLSGCENDGDNDDSSFSTVTSIIQGDSQKVKRKISRKKLTNIENCASVSENSTSTSIQNEQSKLQDPEYFRKVCFPSDPVNDVFNYTGVSIDNSDQNNCLNGFNRNCNKTSFIKAVPFSNVDRGWQRHDPVNRYHRYKASWDQKKAPGESPHKELRWAVKAAMMIREVPQPRDNRMKSGKPKNNYQAPGENKRSDLRWQVRQEIANPDIYFD